MQISSVLAFSVLFYLGSVWAKVEPPKVDTKECDAKDMKDGQCSNAKKPAEKLPDCLNQKRCCSVWESVGECKRKKDWMKTNCPKACKFCTSTNASGSCKDIDVKCSQWAKDGECDKNNDWMEENCPVACKVCERTPEELNEICGLHKEKECKDYYDSCKKWAKDGECESNSWWMRENCGIACKTCKMSN